jgi:5'(3')-deoxyribonucleotidase
MRLRIAIDMDETLADTLTHHLNVYNGEFAQQLTKADCRGRALKDAVPQEHQGRILEHYKSTWFWRDIQPMPRSTEVLAELQIRHEVFVVSAAMEYPTSLGPKYEWLKQHFNFLPDSHIVFCGDKSIISTEIMIDDHARHFQRYRGSGFLYDAPHNCDEARYPRLRDWTEIAARFLSD